MKKSIKKSFILFIIAVMLLTAVPFSGIDFTGLTASAVGSKSNSGYVGDWYYSTRSGSFIEYGGASISRYSGNEKNVVIPSEINGIPVTCVESLNYGDNYDVSNIESVVVPESVKELSGSFCDLPNLKSVTLSEGLEVIGDYTFANCTNLTKIDIPDSVTEIGGKAFINSGIEMMPTEIDGWELTYDFLDDDAEGIKEIIFNSNQIELKNLSYAQVDRIICNGIIDFWENYEDNPYVVVNKNLEIVCNGGIWSELHCLYTQKMGLYSHLNEENGVITYNSVPVENVIEYESGDYRYYLNSDNEAVISKYLGKDSEVTVPETIDGYTVGEIGTMAFSGLVYENGFSFIGDSEQITSIVLPKTVKKIGAFAFEWNEALVSIAMPDAIKVISSNAFECCRSLKNIDWPANLEVIGPMAFYACDGLTNIQIPEGVTQIGSNSFGSCANLQSVSFPETLTSIGYFAFIYNEKLESISIPDSVKEIGDGVFIGCEALTTAKLPVTIETIPTELFFFTGLSSIDIPETVTKIENSAFEETKLGEVELPQNLKYIGAYAFCASYLTEINLPSSVIHIGSGAFAYNEFESLVIEWQNIKRIPAETFKDCDNLKRVEIKGQIKEIGVKAFNDCTALEEIILGDNVEKIHNSAFEYCIALETVTIPEGINYMASAAFKKCTNLKSLYFNAAKCVICLKSIYDVTRYQEGPFNGCGITELYIGDKVEYLDWYLFAAMKSIVNVEIPENVKYIGEAAFKSCDSLQNVTLPDSLEYIDDYAFDLCSSLLEITIPTNTKVLGYCAFSRCENLTTIYFNATNCKVTNRAGEITIPEDWSTASPFYRTNITNIIFGGTVTAISSNSEIYGTFENCDTLQSVEIPDTVEKIGTAAFKNCTNLETAVIPESVTEIADDAFDGCENLIIYCSETSYACTYAMAKGIAVSTFIIETIPNQTYSGSQIKPVITVSLPSGVLTENKDFTVSYSNNINVGEAKVKITGLGDYRNFASVASFTIVTRKISTAKVNDISAQNYTGKAVTPNLIITYNGKVLENGKDYKLTYKDNVKIGMATVYVDGIGNFSGTTKATFEIQDLSPLQILLNSLRDLFSSLLARFFRIG